MTTPTPKAGRSDPDCGWGHYVAEFVTQFGRIFDTAYTSQYRPPGLTTNSSLSDVMNFAIHNASLNGVFIVTPPCVRVLLY